MADFQLGFKDYLKAAFNLKVRLPLLGLMPLNKLALVGFGILGLGHPAFWLLGMAYEAAYLLWLTGSERFQRIVRAERLTLSRESWQEYERSVLARLDEEGRGRYRRLLARREEIQRIHASSGGLDALGLTGLDQVLPTFLRLLDARHRIQDLMRSTPRNEIEIDLLALRKRLEAAPPDSALARSIEDTKKIQEARLANLERSNMSLQYLETELERIEKQLMLIAEGSAVSRDPEQWSLGIDSVMQTIQSSTEWMAQHSDLFEPIESPPSIQSPSAGRAQMQ